MRILTALFFLICMWMPEKSVSAGEQRGTIWIEMTDQAQKAERADLMSALAIRLGNWRILAKPDDVALDGVCPRADGFDRYLVRVVRTNDGYTILFFECESKEPLWEEHLPADSDASKIHRQAAVLVALTLNDSRENEKAAGQPPGHSGAEGDDVSEPKKKRRRIRGTVSLLPGATVAPRRWNAVFTGTAGLGALFRDKLWVELGVAPSSRYKGTADKNSNDDETDISIGVQETAFSMALKYCLEINARWWGAGAVSLSYSHFVTKNLNEDKFEIDEMNPAARGSVTPSLALFFQPLRIFCISIFVGLNISFGERVFKMRGEDAVNLGTLRAVTGLGVVFVI